MANIYRPEFEEGERPEGFRSRRARIGYELGTELIGASQWELPPGEAAYPYHFHYADEELVVVLHGRPDIVVYPDADKIGVGERLPRGAGLRAYFRREDAVGYWDDEPPPAA